MTGNRRLLRRRRERARRVAVRGTFCESQMYSGDYYGAKCCYRARGYQLYNDIYVCGIHARAYLQVASLDSIRAWNEGRGPDPFPDSRAVEAFGG